MISGKLTLKQVIQIVCGMRQIIQLELKKIS